MQHLRIIQDPKQILESVDTETDNIIASRNQANIYIYIYIYIYLQSQKKCTKVSLNRIIRTILNRLSESW